MPEREPRPISKPLPSEGSGEEPSSEQIESNSETVATKKLEKLMSPDCPDFAVRFANIEEYRKVMNEGKFVSTLAWKSEVGASYTSTGERVSAFESWLKNGSRRWEATIAKQTEWDISAANLRDYENLMWDFKEIHQQVKSEGVKDIRAETINRFRDHIQKWKKYRTFVYAPPTMGKMIAAALSDLPDYETERFDSESVEKVRSFFESKQPVSRKQLRKVVQLITNAEEKVTEDDRSSMKYHSRQYHVAMIVDSAGIMEHSRFHDYAHFQQTAVEDNLLAIVAIMPNKELWQEIRDRSSKGGKLAHAIFDSKGILRYPAERKELT